MIFLRPSIFAVALTLPVSYLVLSVAGGGNGVVGGGGGGSDGGAPRCIVEWGEPDIAAAMYLNLTINVFM